MTAYILYLLEISLKTVKDDLTKTKLVAMIAMIAMRMVLVLSSIPAAAAAAVLPIVCVLPMLGSKTKLASCNAHPLIQLSVLATLTTLYVYLSDYESDPLVSLEPSREM